MIRLTWLWTFIVWALGALAVFVFKSKSCGLASTERGGLWVTLPLLLASLWLPLFSGVVQGRQDFSGWAGRRFSWIGKIVVAAILVLALGFGAAGMMAGALLGVGFSALVVIWRRVNCGRTARSI